MTRIFVQMKIALLCSVFLLYRDLNLDPHLHELMEAEN